jgi:hypothetical protein
MKQTAVEWFMDKIGEKQRNGFYVIDTLQDVQNVFKQAKEMEKQQIIDLVDALKEIEAICDNQNSAHEHIWRIAYGAIKQFKKK